MNPGETNFTSYQRNRSYKQWDETLKKISTRVIYLVQAVGPQFTIYIIMTFILLHIYRKTETILITEINYILKHNANINFNV